MNSAMEKIDFDKLRKMPPERRVTALKELQEKLNELIKERSKEIADSEREIKDAQDFLKDAEEELRVLEEMEAEAPGIKKVDVEKLFERDGGGAERAEPMRPRGQALEAIAGEAPRGAPAQDDRAYVDFLAHQPVTNIYERINRIRDDIKTTGIISMYQQEKLEQFREALHEKEDAIRDGEYAAGRKAEALLTAAEKAVMYTSGSDRKHFYHTQHN